MAGETREATLARLLGEFEVALDGNRDQFLADARAAGHGPDDLDDFRAYHDECRPVWRARFLTAVNQHLDVEQQQRDWLAQWSPTRVH